MKTIAEHIRAGYEIRSSHAAGVDGHFIILQKTSSVIMARLPISRLSGKLEQDAGKRVTFVEVSQ